MKDLEKVNSAELFSFWKNLSVGLLVLIGVILLSRVLPFYFSPIVGLVAAAVLYTMLYNNKLRPNSSCMMVPYAIFYCVIVYSFSSIILNVLDIWDIVHIPKEISFFNDPYVCTLLLDPICFIVMLVFYFRGNSLSICRDCKLTKGIAMERGKFGEIISVESNVQLVNMIWVFGLLSMMVWVYFFVFYYQQAVLNNRDWYIFFWMNLVAFVMDELYFASRYYNIYLDLKENGEIISEQELSDMTAKTYLRFYVICGNHIYVNTQMVEPGNPGSRVLDTPFITKRNVNGITTAEVMGIIQQITGIKGGELRFYYGRKSMDMAKHRILRYFYFLNGSPEDYPEMKISGEWVDFKLVNLIYNEQPTAMAKILLSDISRMSTIILTQKLFDERGNRKIKIKSYRPTYDLNEVRMKNYDFQDDKWIRIAMSNSDNRGFQWKRLWPWKHSGEKKRWEQRQ